MSSKGTGVLSRFQRMDLRYLYALTLILMIVAILRPLGLPVTVTWPTKGIYDAIQKLPPGSKVLYGHELLASEWAEYYPTSTVVIDHLFSRGIKVYFVSFQQSGAPVLLRGLIIDKLDGGKLYGRKYGEDWVELGYLPGLEPTMTAFGTDIRKVVTKDVYGKPLDEIPMMKGVNKAEDFDLMVSTAGTLVDVYIRQFVGKFGMKMVSLTLSGNYPNFVPYLTTGQILGLMNGLRAAREYESLLGKPGLAGVTVYTDALTLIYAMLFVLLAVGNVTYFMERSRRRGR